MVDISNGSGNFQQFQVQGNLLFLWTQPIDPKLNERKPPFQSLIKHADSLGMRFPPGGPIVGCTSSHFITYLNAIIYLFEISHRSYKISVLPAGGIGSSFQLSVECSIDTNGQNPLLPTSESIPPIPLALSVELCPIGTEEKGVYCQPCDLNFYNYNSSTCQACPEGKLP